MGSDDPLTIDRSLGLFSEMHHDIDYTFKRYGTTDEKKCSLLQALFSKLYIYEWSFLVYRRKTGTFYYEGFGPERIKITNALMSVNEKMNHLADSLNFGNWDNLMFRMSLKYAKLGEPSKKPLIDVIDDDNESEDPDAVGKAFNLFGYVEPPKVKAAKKEPEKPINLDDKRWFGPSPKGPPKADNYNMEMKFDGFVFIDGFIPFSIVDNPFESKIMKMIHQWEDLFMNPLIPKDIKTKKCNEIKAKLYPMAEKMPGFKYLNDKHIAEIKANPAVLEQPVFEDVPMYWPEYITEKVKVKREIIIKLPDSNENIDKLSPEDMAVEDLPKYVLYMLYYTYPAKIKKTNAGTTNNANTKHNNNTGEGSGDNNGNGDDVKPTSSSRSTSNEITNNGGNILNAINNVSNNNINNINNNAVHEYILNRIIDQINMHRKCVASILYADWAPMDLWFSIHFSENANSRLYTHKSREWEKCRYGTPDLIKAVYTLKVKLDIKLHKIKVFKFDIAAYNKNLEVIRKLIYKPVTKRYTVNVPNLLYLDINTYASVKLNVKSAKVLDWTGYFYSTAPMLKHELIITMHKIGAADRVEATSNIPTSNTKGIEVVSAVELNAEDEIVSKKKKKFKDTKAKKKKKKWVMLNMSYPEGPHVCEHCSMRGIYAVFTCFSLLLIFDVSLFALLGWCNGGKKTAEPTPWGREETPEQLCSWLLYGEEEAVKSISNPLIPFYVIFAFFHSYPNSISLPSTFAVYHIHDHPDSQVASKVVSFRKKERDGCMVCHVDALRSTVNPCSIDFINVVRHGYVRVDVVSMTALLGGASQG
jgi:hypothetical protein